MVRAGGNAASGVLAELSARLRMRCGESEAPAWRRPAWSFEHRSGAALLAVSIGAQKGCVG